MSRQIIALTILCSWLGSEELNRIQLIPLHQHLVTSFGQHAVANDTLPPVEKNPPNTNYKAAFEGQTRIAGMKTNAEYEGIIVTDKLRLPWAIAVLPDRRCLVNEKPGAIRIVDLKGKVGDSITGLPPVKFADQGGLLGLALDPGFANNRILYWAYSENHGEENVTAVAKGRLSKD